MPREKGDARPAKTNPTFDVPEHWNMHDTCLYRLFGFTRETNSMDSTTDSTTSQTSYDDCSVPNDVLTTDTKKMKVAAFDLDGTLITPKSGAKFPKDSEDWKFLEAWKSRPKKSTDRKRSNYGPKQSNDDSCNNSNDTSSDNIIAKKLRQLHDNGYQIMIFTNQKGISLGNSDLKSITDKVNNIQQIVGVDLQCYIAVGGDMYRKPRIQGWVFATEVCNTGRTVDMMNSFFVGNSAGRPETSDNPKDHNAVDFQFALNIGLRFDTPECFFHGAGDVAKAPESFDFDPRLIGSSEQSLHLDTSIDKPTVILFVGAPGSGKTTVYRKYYSKFEHINQDTLKYKEKCMKACKDSLRSGKSCVIDNQNKDSAIRQSYIKIAKDLGASAKCVYMDVPKDLCFHLNAYRTLNPRTPEHRPEEVPKVTIHTFYKYLQPPELSEGFDNIDCITADKFQSGPFETTNDEQLFHSFLI